MSLVAILDELASKLDSLPNVAQVRGRLNADPTPPCIDIYPGDPFGSQDEAGFGDSLGAYIFTVRARAGTSDHEAGQEVLLSWMDDTSDVSVAVLLEDDQTLNGLASSVYVTGPSGFRQYIDSNGQAALLGCEWAVKVLPEVS